MTAGCSTDTVQITPGKATLTVTQPVTGAGGALTLAYSAADAGIAITKFQVNYNGTWEDIAGSEAGGGAASGTTLTRLDTSTTYSIQVRAVNAKGTGTASDPVAGTTLAHEAHDNDIRVSADTAHGAYYGVGHRVIFRAQGIFNTSTNHHTSITLAADGVFPNETAYWAQNETSNVDIEVFVRSDFTVGVSFRRDGRTHFTDGGEELSPLAEKHFRIIIGQNQRYLSINLNHIEAQPTEPYSGVTSNADFRTAITNFFDHTNRSSRVPFFIQVIDTRESIIASLPPISRAPTVTYDATTPERGGMVVPTLSSEAGLDSTYHGTHIWQWQARKTYGYGNTWEFTTHTTKTLTVPANAEYGSEWRITWMRNTFIEFPDNHVVVTPTAAPTLTYDNDTPDRGDVVTARLSYTYQVTDQRWELQARGTTTWLSVARATDTSITIPQTARHTDKYRYTWIRNNVRESSGFVTVMRAGISRPSAVTNLTATAGDGQVMLSWGPPEVDGGTPITYTVRYANEEINRGTNTDYTATSLTNGTEYIFRVVAVNDSGEGIATSVAATPAGVPGAPQNVVTIPGSRTITVRWDAADDNGAPILRYELDGIYNTRQTAAPTDRSYTFTGLQNGRGQGGRIRAVNSQGAGPWVSYTETPATGSSNVADDFGDLVINSISHIPARGVYTVGPTYDLGAVYKTRVSIYLVAGVENVSETSLGFWDSAVGLFDDQDGLFDGLTSAPENDGVEAYAEVRYRNAETDRWSPWHRIVSGEVTGRYFETRLVLISFVVNLRPRVQDFKFTLSLARRTESGQASVLAGNSPTGIQFVKDFHTLETVVANGISIADGVRVNIPQQDRNGFTAHLLDSTTGVAGDINYIATGFGSTDHTAYTGTTQATPPTIRRGIKPKITYNTTSPERGSYCKARFTNTTGVTEYRWQREIGSNWIDIPITPTEGFSGIRTRTLGIPFGATGGRRIRIAWRRYGTWEFPISTATIRV